MTPMKKTPTSTDIFRFLGTLDEKLVAIHSQVKLTNGRVTALESKEQRRKDIEEWEEKQSNRSQAPSPVKEGWTSREKTLTAIITALLAIVATLVGAGKL